MRIIQIFILLLLPGVRLTAQELPSRTRDQLEQLAESTGREILPDDELRQRLAYYLSHPININTTTADELKDLHLLSDIQIQNFLNYRKLNGNLIDIYELQSIPKWDVSAIQMILPYIKIGQAQNINEQLLSRLKGQHSLIMEFSRVLERPAGYDTSFRNHYLGTPDHIRLRYRYQFKDLLQFGISGEKDAGEQFFKGAQKAGFDFYSFYLFLRKIGHIKALALGDFTVNMGQGLIQWQTLAFGKGTDVMSIKRQAPVLLPYRSSGEYNYNRGAGITVQKGLIEVTAFGSLKKISGNTNSDSIEWFSSFLNSGLHRSPSEIADRNRITQFSTGGNFSYHDRKFSVGLNSVYNRFSVPLMKKAAPYNMHAFSGRQLFQSGIDFSFSFRNMHFFGEAAEDGNRHRALVSGVLIPLDAKVDLSLLYRNIAKDYQSISGDAFTENSQPVNERGTYACIGIKPDAYWQLNAYADIFSMPWLRYRVSGPSNGYDYLLQAVFHPDRQMEFSLRYRINSKPLDVTENQNIAYPLPVIRKSLRLAMTDKINDLINIKARCEVLWLSQIQSKQEQGFLAFLEMNFRIRKWIRLDVRLQQFESDSYESRIYAYGSEALSGFSMPAFYDKGIYGYFLLQLRASKHLNAKILYNQTKYRNKNNISSGLDLINGNRKSDIGFQLQYLF